MPPLEAWEKVLIDAEAYQSDIHAFINCTACHGGQAVGNMTAHDGLIADPSADPETGCASCHPNIVPSAEQSLHFTLEGYDTAVYARSSPDHYATLENMESYHCDSCHATCGDCHVSQPNSVGGGLLAGHTFVEKPPMSQTCTACHGSRVKNEYYGLNEGEPGDVHLRVARLACTDCHSGDQMHGIGEYAGATSRYDGEPSPTCESCHADQIGKGSGILQHEIHGTDILSCQACHSVSYTNCTNCHVDRTEDDIAYYSVESSSVGFYLGKNPLQSTDRPWEYVTLRHVPVDVNSFDVYGDNLLDNFLSIPTWKYATPHNIQLDTPQNQSCAGCHKNPDIWLTEDKLAPGEDGGANLDVIVDGPPPLPEGWQKVVSDIAERIWRKSHPATPVPTTAAPAEATETPAPSSDADFWGSDSVAPAETPAPTEQSDADFWGSDSAAP